MITSSDPMHGHGDLQCTVTYTYLTWPIINLILRIMRLPVVGR